MVLAIEPSPVPFPKGGLHRKVNKAGVRAGLETPPPPNNLAVRGAQVVFQEKVVFEQRDIGQNAKKCFTEMDKDGDLKNIIRVEID
jgi:hypothetical protein